MPVTPYQRVVAQILVDILTPDVDDDVEAGDRSYNPAGWSAWAPARSSAISQVKHKLRTGEMLVRFNKRGSYPDYLFMNVPRELFRQWKRVQSPGRFYHRRIKDRYGV